MKKEKGGSLFYFTQEERDNVKYIVSDVDDTITRDGKLYPPVLEALYRVKMSGRTIVLLTGGSAGWADGYIRQWPVDAVIAESGAVMMCHSKGGEIVSLINPVIRKDEVLQMRRKLIEYTSPYPFSSDQFARVFDVAYDKKKMSDAEIKALKNILTLFGASFSESSIHINAWFGDYSKKSALLYYMTESLGIEEEDYLENGIYLGDSLNDEPLFEYFPHSIGMHSVEDMREKFTSLPTWITDGTGGDGWVEFAHALLDEKSGEKNI